MERIRDGFLETGKVVGFDVSVHDLGHGHHEITAYRALEWERGAQLSPVALEMYLEAVERHREETESERAERSLKNSAIRARKSVRRYCKVIGADTLLTLTYRANVADLDVAKADLKGFNRRVLAILPGFKFVCGFERQKRGAWHMHLACAGLPTFFEKTNRTGQKYRVKSFDVFRAIWRSVAGDAGGNVDVARRKRNSRRSPAKIAAYLSKYITKAFTEGEKWSNRWTRYGDMELPDAVHLGRWEHMADAMQAAFGLLSEHDAIVKFTCSEYVDMMFIAAERPCRPGLG